jgi:hypothetical protein
MDYGDTSQHLEGVQVVRRGRNLIRTSLFIELAQLQELREISIRTGAPVAHLVRRGIDAYLHSQDTPRSDDQRATIEQPC